jgi:hypothetical protein
MYKAHTEECNMVLEAVADYELGIWHAFFGMTESHNDINVVKCSLVLARLAGGHDLAINYEINAHTYNKMALSNR